MPPLAVLNPNYAPDLGRMAAVQEPMIPIVADWTRQHPGTLSLGQGVVYYGPPPAAVEKLAQAFADPLYHRYQPVQGITLLREAIQTKLKTDNGIRANLEQIVVTAGSNMGFMHAVLAITQPGDAVILLAPYYFNHEMAIRMAGCEPVIVPTDANYQPDLEKLRQSITPKTRAIVTISPNNPTGVVYPPATLVAINQLCQSAGIYHISDEAYEYFTYENATHFSPGCLLGASEYTLSLFSLSKAYGFASWRMGYMVIPPQLQLAIQKIQDTILICPPLVSQYAALGALQVGADYCRQHLPALLEVRQRVLKELETLGPEFTIPPALGAFYFLLKIQTPIPALTLVEQLIREYGVAVLPGDTFGMTGTEECYLRVAYGALTPDTATEATARLVRGLQALVTASKNS
jgi:aspartate/methionine/tyrosine aminotransferase